MFPWMNEVDSDEGQVKVDATELAGCIDNVRIVSQLFESFSAIKFVELSVKNDFTTTLAL